MHIQALFLALSLAGSVLAAPQRAPRPRGPPGIGIQMETSITGEAPTKQFILEFVPGGNKDALLAQLSSSGAKILKEFKSDIFSGVSIEAPEENVDSLLALAPVKKAWRSTMIKLMPTIGLKQFSDQAEAKAYDVHGMTGVDKVHAAGYFGAGAVVAVVDTGVDYNHPALGGGFGPGHKVAGGWDLVGDGYWPYNGEGKQPDADVNDNIGHGTHVSGIVAGKTDFWTGVAPEATLLNFKVFSTQDSTDEATLIDAFLMAHEADADVITASIGGVGGFSENAWAEVASRLVDSGRVVTIAAGNNGQVGPYFASNGASGTQVLSIASVEADTVIAEPFGAVFNLGGVSNSTTLGYQPWPATWPSDLKGLPIRPVSFDTEDPAQACNPLPEDTPNLAGVVSLVRMGGCYVAEKQANLEAFGAEFVLLYNDNLEPPSDFWSWDWGAWAGLIDNKAGGSVTVDFTRSYPGKVGMYNAAIGGVPSYFSTYGATYDLDVKPDIAAPGGDIWSSYPGGTYAVMSGTSMATPYVAGVAALYVGKTGGRKVLGNGFAKKLSKRIISSGAALPWATSGMADQPGYFAPVDFMGNGLIDAYKVVMAETELNFEKFTLNDTHHFERYHSVDITNTGTKDVEYRFEVQPAGAYDVLSAPGGPVRWSSSLVPSEISLPVSLPQGKFVVKPGETKTAKINFDPPVVADNSMLPSYSGKILITGDNKESLSVPYLGIAGNLQNTFLKVWADGFPQVYSGWDGYDLNAKSNFTFNLDTNVQDFPKLYTATKWGVEQVRWDIFEAGWGEHEFKWPLVPGKDKYVGAATSWIGSASAYYFDPANDKITEYETFPLQDIFRMPDGYYNSYWWLGVMADGTTIKPGSYVMRISALAPFGNPEHSDNWAAFVSPFTVLPPA